MKEWEAAPVDAFALLVDKVGDGAEERFRYGRLSNGLHVTINVKRTALVVRSQRRDCDRAPGG
jgi:hypothetical protein